MPILRQNRSGSSHHFAAAAYPTASSQHFQTLQQTSNHMMGSDFQSAIPVTALLFSQNSSLPIGNNGMQHVPVHQHQQQQHEQQQIPAYMYLLEKQPWFHGKITRKHAENVLANKPIGSFLVRQSESGNLNDFSLSLV
jgi:hypothetical protein